MKRAAWSPPITASQSTRFTRRLAEDELKTLRIFSTTPYPICAAANARLKGKAAFAPFTIKSSRDLFEIKDEKDLAFARDVALLAINGFAVPADKVSSSWLSSHVSESEVREWL